MSLSGMFPHLKTCPSTALGPPPCVGGHEELEPRETSGWYLFPAGPSRTPACRPPFIRPWVGRSPSDTCVPFLGAECLHLGAFSAGVPWEGPAAHPRALRGPPALEQRCLPMSLGWRIFQSLSRPSLRPSSPWPPKHQCAYYQAMGSGFRALPSHHLPQPRAFTQPAALSTVPQLFVQGRQPTLGGGAGSGLQCLASIPPARRSFVCRRD